MKRGYSDFWVMQKNVWGLWVSFLKTTHMITENRCLIFFIKMIFKD